MIIYGLFDPRTGELRYVGQTKHPAQVRVTQHLRPSVLKHKCHRNHWLKQLRDAGVRPEIEELETVGSKSEANDAERFWIAYWRSVGARLTNETAGGEGRDGSRLSMETRAKMSAAHKGKTFSEEHRRNLSEMQMRHRSRPFRDDTGRQYRSLKEAAAAVGSTIQNVHRVLVGKRKTTRGIGFHYLETV